MAECWNREKKDDLNFRSGILDREFESCLGLITLIDLIRLGDGINKAYWSLKNYGDFSTRSTFFKLTRTSPKHKIQVNRN